MKNTGVKGLLDPPVNELSQKTAAMSARNVTSIACVDRSESTPKLPNTGFQRLEYGSEKKMAPVVIRENASTIQGILSASGSCHERS